jgi:hypothetical protein
LYDIRTNVRNTYEGGVVRLGMLLDDKTARDSIIRLAVRIEQPAEGPLPPSADGVVIPIWAFGPTLPLPELPVAVELGGIHRPDHG